MTATNFAASLAFCWRPGFDDPKDGFHETAGDPGRGTKGGVIAATWARAVSSGIVHGTLAEASNEQLSDVLHAMFWGQVCDALPSGVDFLLFQGRMMTGRFPWLFQQCLGFLGPDDVDGWIGPESVAAAKSCEPVTLIDALIGAHGAYLSGLPTFAEFGKGWVTRLQAARLAAIAMADEAPVA